jgi:hypothetical protein
VSNWMLLYGLRRLRLHNLLRLFAAKLQRVSPPVAAYGEL